MSNKKDRFCEGNNDGEESAADQNKKQSHPFIVGGLSSRGKWHVRVVAGLDVGLHEEV